MNRIKIFAVAAGFVAAAGITTAGNVYIGSENVGTYSGNVTVTGTGDIRFPSGTTINGSGGGTTGPNCGTNAHAEGSQCVCDTGYEDPFNPGVGDTNVEEGVNCVGVTGGGDGGGDGGGGGTPGSCDGVGVTGMSRSNSPTAFVPFPGTHGTKEKIEVRRGEYAAIRIKAPSTSNRYGKMFFISDTFAPNGTLTANISNCPGDFNPLNGDSNCRYTGGTLSFWWITGSNNLYLCDLQPGQEYYLNLTYARGTGNNLTNTCDFSSCGHLMQWDNAGF